MTDTIRELRRQATESTYGSDREAAVELLADRYPDADEDDRAAIARTLRTVATDATYGDERDLAQAALDDLVYADAPSAAEHAVAVHCRLAADGDRAAERERAVDRLREYGLRGLPADALESIRAALRAVSESATRSSEREHARAALVALEDAEPSSGESSGAGESNESGDAYLAVSLAEHVESAAGDEPAACRERLAELAAFLDANPVADDGYEGAVAAVEEQRRALDTVAGGRDELDPERRERVQEAAERVRRLYLRAAGA
jgi:hypothetical protein